MCGLTCDFLRFVDEQIRGGTADSVSFSCYMPKIATFSCCSFQSSRGFRLRSLRDLFNRVLIFRHLCNRLCTRSTQVSSTIFPRILPYSLTSQQLQRVPRVYILI